MQPNNSCYKCANYVNNGKCLAFFNGIPKRILEGKDKHKTPTKSQKNTVVFEPITN